MSASDRHEGRITYDAIGLAHGHFDGRLIKSAFQPIYRIADDRLCMVALRAYARPGIEARPLHPHAFFGAFKGAERFELEDLCRAVHIANLPYADAGVATLGVHFDPRDRDELHAALETVEERLGALEEECFDRPSLVCMIDGRAGSSPDFLAEMAGKIRAARHRIAVTGLGPDDRTLTAIASIAPDYACFEGAWFRRAAQWSDTRLLMCRLVDLLHERQVAVMAEGLETRGELAAAREVGADFFQGHLLAPPQLAGELMLGQEGRLAALLGDNVIPLRRPA